MAISYLGIGSNLGDRFQNIRLALKKIRKLKKIKLLKVSKIIETKPVGGPLQGNFLNAAVKIQTRLSPTELLNNLQLIEQELGRINTVRNGPRAIDLDILTFAEKKIKTKRLVVPHPRMKNRQFVLIPLQQIAPKVAKRIMHENN